MMTVLVGEWAIRDLLLSFVSSPCDRTIFVEQVSSQPFTAEHGRADGDRHFIRTGSLSVLNCADKRSNACARTDQCAERLKMHGSRESQMLQLGFGAIVTKNA